MYKLARSIAVVVSLTMLLAGVRTVAQSQAKTTMDEIRQELHRLPYYGVFDFIAFSYDKGTVTLMGDAYRPGLRRDAERAVKRASAVDHVVDKIEDLPPSQLDDELRWKLYYVIYRDPVLAEYAPGGGMLLRPGYLFKAGRFIGMEPAGNHGIHIIVKNLHVTLLGVVDNEGDKSLAGIKAREVSGALADVNDLMVEKHQTRKEWKE